MMGGNNTIRGLPGQPPYPLPSLGPAVTVTVQVVSLVLLLPPA